MSKKSIAILLTFLYEIISICSVSYISYRIYDYQTELYKKYYYLPEDGYVTGYHLNPIVYLGPILLILNIFVGYYLTKYCKDPKIPILGSLPLYVFLFIASGLFLLFGNYISLVITITLWIVLMLSAVPYVGCIAIGAYRANKKLKLLNNDNTL